MMHKRNRGGTNEAKNKRIARMDSPAVTTGLRGYSTRDVSRGLESILRFSKFYLTTALQSVELSVQGKQNKGRNDAKTT